MAKWEYLSDYNYTYHGVDFVIDMRYCLADSAHPEDGADEFELLSATSGIEAIDNMVLGYQEYDFITELEEHIKHELRYNREFT